MLAGAKQKGHAPRLSCFKRLTLVELTRVRSLGSTSDNGTILVGRQLVGVGKSLNLGVEEFDYLLAASELNSPLAVGRPLRNVINLSHQPFS